MDDVPTIEHHNTFFTLRMRICVDELAVKKQKASS